MFFSYDKTGFPLIPLFRTELEVHMLPVTKIQFERFLAESHNLGDDSYKEALKLNPSVSHKQFTPDNREQLFVTGILPEEALSFARWMGNEFDLPTVEEWRFIYDELALGLDPLHDSTTLPSQCPAEPVGALLQRLWDQCQPYSLFDLTLMKGGLVEWVRQDRAWAGLGAPRPEFHPNLWDPLSDVVKPISLKTRLKYFGFRLVRRIGQLDAGC